MAVKVTDWLKESVLLEALNAASERIDQLEARIERLETRRRWWQRKRR
jgi:hypothetical protein